AKPDGSVRHIINGIATAQKMDLANERCIYDDAVPAYRALAQEALESTSKAGPEPSMGPLREMHQLTCAGKITNIICHDQDRSIEIEAELVDEKVFQKVRRGLYRMVSHSGTYSYRRCENDNSDIRGSGNGCDRCGRDVVVNYGLKRLAEISLVDSGALPEANITYVKVDGAAELIKAKGDLMTDRQRRHERISLTEHLHDAHEACEKGGVPGHVKCDIAKARDTAEAWFAAEYPDTASGSSIASGGTGPTKSVTPIDRGKWHQ